MTSDFSSYSIEEFLRASTKDELLTTLFNDTEEGAFCSFCGNKLEMILHKAISILGCDCQAAKEERALLDEEYLLKQRKSDFYTKYSEIKQKNMYITLKTIYENRLQKIEEKLNA